MTCAQKTWDYFPYIVCISLRQRPDRTAAARERFKSAQIPIQFLMVDRHPQGGQVGCFQSHQRAMQNALALGHKRVLIFEDDAVPTFSNSVSAHTQLRECVDFLEHNEWDAFFFGHCAKEMLFKRDKNIHQFAGHTSMCTHAYAANENFMRQALQYHHLKSEPIDSLFTRVRPNPLFFTIYPMMFHQDRSTSGDIDRFSNALTFHLPLPFTRLYEICGLYAARTLFVILFVILLFVVCASLNSRGVTCAKQFTKKRCK